MYAAERRAEILRLVQERGRVAVQALAEHLSVAPETVRKDLNELERHGLVARTHGGVVRVDRLSYITPVTERSGLREAEKRAIAAHAVTQLEQDSTIGIDAGTSTIALARAIPPALRLTVVTYSIVVAGILADHPGVTVYTLGGEFRPNSRASVGTWAEQQLSSITLDACFISVDGISVQHGLTTHNLAESRVKALMIAASHRAFVLADSSKLGRREFAKVGALSSVDHIITDAGSSSADWVAPVAEAGSRLDIVAVRSAA